MSRGWFNFSMKAKSSDIGAKDDTEHADFFRDAIIWDLCETSKSMLNSRGQTDGNRLDGALSKIPACLLAFQNHHAIAMRHPRKDSGAVFLSDATRHGVISRHDDHAN